MKCPHCNVTLAVTERQGVEIDHCPQCRGVWLDRGELDKIIERYDVFPHKDAHRAAAPPPPIPQRHYDDDDDHRHRGYSGKRKSFWHELFD